MSERWSQGLDGVDELGRDMELAETLELLDPSSTDPNYWMLFRSWVLQGAAGELARRRLMAELTVTDVMTSWARTVVPTAILAAALAGILLVRAPAEVAPQPTIGIEELLLSELEGTPIPSALAPSAAQEEAVAFASEVF